jgi:MFS family permease
MMLVAGPLAGTLGNRYGSKVPFALGGAICSVGLLTLALAHATVASVTGFNVLVNIGIGLTFAAMPNLIVNAVPRAQTGESTGFNTLLRLVGMSIGSQVAASILASNAGAGGYSDEHGFVVAFAVGSAVSLLAALVVLLVPPAREHIRTDAAAVAGAEA